MTVEAEDPNSRTLPENKRFDRPVSSRKPFGLDPTFKGKRGKGDSDVKVYRKGGTEYIARNQVSR